MGWKYVMFENTFGKTKYLFPVIFPDKLVHADVYDQLRTIMPGWRSAGVKAVSAGTIEHVEVMGLGGDSETLKLKSHKTDETVIESYEYGHGIK